MKDQGCGGCKSSQQKRREPGIPSEGYRQAARKFRKDDQGQQLGGKAMLFQHSLEALLAQDLSDGRADENECDTQAARQVEVVAESCKQSIHVDHIESFSRSEVFASDSSAVS